MNADHWPSDMPIRSLCARIDLKDLERIVLEASVDETALGALRSDGTAVASSV
jgi:hypothetical protein